MQGKRWGGDRARGTKGDQSEEVGRMQIKRMGGGEGGGKSLLWAPLPGCYRQ
jgi:hypothetical protein